ncbi:MAG: Hpt domain-containing protein [Pseudomonadota bacterium]
MSSHLSSPSRAAPGPRLKSLEPAILGENTMHDVSLQKELFDLYFGQTATYLAALSESVTTRDRRAWSNAAHGLKGTARTLGLMRLAEATTIAEGASPAHALLSEIEDAVVDARAAAAAYLASAERAA